MAKDMKSWTLASVCPAHFFGLEDPNKVRGGVGHVGGWLVAWVLGWLVLACFVVVAWPLGWRGDVCLVGCPVLGPS